MDLEEEQFAALLQCVSSVKEAHLAGKAPPLPPPQG